jgi:hypothetical protein
VFPGSNDRAALHRIGAAQASGSRGSWAGGSAGAPPCGLPLRLDRRAASARRPPRRPAPVWSTRPSSPWWLTTARATNSTTAADEKDQEHYELSRCRITGDNAKCACRSHVLQWATDAELLALIEACERAGWLSHVQGAVNPDTLAALAGVERERVDNVLAVLVAAGIVEEADSLFSLSAQFAALTASASGVSLDAVLGLAELQRSRLTAILDGSDQRAWEANRRSCRKRRPAGFAHERTTETPLGRIVLMRRP